MPDEFEPTCALEQNIIFSGSKYIKKEMFQEWLFCTIQYCLYEKFFLDCNYFFYRF